MCVLNEKNLVAILFSCQSLLLSTNVINDIFNFDNGCIKVMDLMIRRSQAVLIYLYGLNNTVECGRASGLP